MYSRRRSNKPSDSLVSKFREDFDNLMQPHHSSALPPASRSAEAPAAAGVVGNLQHSASLLDLSQFDDAHVQHLEKTGATPGFSNSDHLSAEWRAPFLGGEIGSNFDVPDFQGAFFPGTPTSGPDGSAQKQMQNYSLGVGLETPVSASASTAHFFPSRSQSLSLSDPVFTQGPSLQQSSTFPQMGTGFPPHLFENPPAQAAVGPEFHGAFQPAARQGDINTAGLRMRDSLQQVPLHWEMQLQPKPGAQYAVSEHEESEGDEFRFRTTLKAATAMIKHQEHPVTYLNKSQLYEVVIRDRQPEAVRTFGQATYRTAVRISFDDDQMRRRPEAAWRLWWEGRGKDEAYKRAGKRQAVEFATPETGHDADHSSNVRLVHETFDGFSVEWTPAPGQPVGCSLYMRFNFLSTDFSLSKGVKGCSVRLCSKTEVLIPGVSTQVSQREICFCNVKTFRDHGAERKLQNDKLHVAKQMDRVKKQIEQADAGDQEDSKRKRRASHAAGRPAKMARTRRSSGSSHSSDDEVDLGSDDLRQRLRSYEQMPQSIKGESRLYRRGEEQDDLDTYPILLQGASPPPPRRQGAFQPPALRPEATTIASSSGSGSLSRPPSNSMKPAIVQSTSLYPTPPHVTSQSSIDTRATSNRPSSHGESNTDAHQLASPSMSSSKFVSRQTPQLAGCTLPTIEVKDLDPSYASPPVPNNKPVCCLFVKPSIAGHRVEDDNYRAIYLRQRTLEGFIMALTSKCGLDHTSVVSAVRVGGRGVPVRVEDDMFESIPEQQDMLAEFDPVDLTHDSAEELFKNEEDGDKTPPIQYQLTLRF